VYCVTLLLLWRISGLEKGRNRRRHNEELHNLYSSLNIIRTTKTRSLRGKEKGRDHLGKEGV
jgi:hypothetical protein